jgi:hypothetical protein
MTPDDGKPLIEYDQATGGWKPRKQFYQHAQIMKFIRPGAVRLSLTGQDTLIQAHAFGNTDGSLVITGQNRNHTGITVNGTLSNLHAPRKIKMIKPTGKTALLKINQYHFQENRSALKYRLSVFLQLLRMPVLIRQFRKDLGPNLQDGMPATYMFTGTAVR